MFLSHACEQRGQLAKFGYFSLRDDAAPARNTVTVKPAGVDARAYAALHIGGEAVAYDHSGFAPKAGNFFKAALKKCGIGLVCAELLREKISLK